MRYGYLKDVGADQIAYATQASEAAFIVPAGGSAECELKLEILSVNYEHSDENMYVAFKKADAPILSQIIKSELPKQKVTLHKLYVQFEVKHYYFNSLVKAVNNITPGIIARILPSTASFFPILKHPAGLLHSLLASCEVQIDDNQFSALSTILSANPRSPPVIVNGSFGTGKTRLLAATTFCAIKHGMNEHKPVRVLVCAHHQASADHFIEEYFGKMFKNIKKVQLVRLTAKDKPSWSEFKQVYHAYWMYKKVMPLDYLVIATTFNTAPHLLKHFEAGFFTHILIDEGSQAREPDAIAPLCLAGPSTKIVIAGDTCQVSA